jgi:amino acid transporter
VIVSGLANFNAKLAFDFPPNAFGLSMGFVFGLGGAVRIAMFDFLGYYDICYVGGEVRNPERVIPRAIILSVLLIAVIYLVMNFSIIGVVPWRDAVKSPFIAADFMERIYGHWAGLAITVMILWTAVASVFALMLGYSRIPYAAALDGYFFPVFGRLHASGQFPHLSLLVIGGLSMLATLPTLEWVIDALLVGRILIQFVGQIFALHALRTRHPDIERPFRMWLYPVPSLIALLGWGFLFATAGPQFILFGLGTLVAGVGAFWLWRRNSAAVVSSE